MIHYHPNTIVKLNKQLFQPSPALSKFVESIQYFELERELDEKTIVEDFPRTALDMVFTFKGSIKLSSQAQPNFELPKYSLVGLFDKKFGIEFSQNVCAVNVRFKSNGIYPLTKVPLHQLWLKSINLENLLGKDIIHLYNRMGEESSPKEKIKLLEQYLLNKYLDAQIHYKFNQCLEYINTTQDKITVTQIANETNTNYKSLDRWFRKFVGTNPKKYLQLNKFKNILSRIEQDSTANWMDYVVDFGFHDQPHFINQFKSIAGITPNAYYQNAKSFFKA